VKRTSLLGGREGRRQKNRRLLTIDRYRSQKEMKIKFKKKNKKHQKCFGRRKKELKKKIEQKTKFRNGEAKTRLTTHTLVFILFIMSDLLFFIIIFFFFQ
jgi:hypothetical protein